MLLKGIHLFSFINCFRVPLLLPENSLLLNTSNSNETIISTTLPDYPIANDNSTRTPITTQRFKQSLTGGHDTCFKANLAFSSSSSSVTLSLAVRLFVH